MHGSAESYLVPACKSSCPPLPKGRAKNQQLTRSFFRFKPTETASLLPHGRANLQLARSLFKLNRAASSGPPLPHGRGFHEKPARVKSFFAPLVTSTTDRRPTGGGLTLKQPPFLEMPFSVQRAIFDADQREAHNLASFPFFPQSADSPCFHPHSRGVASSQVPFGVLDLKRVLPSQCRTPTLLSPGTLGSAATSQSPELGDLLPNLFLSLIPLGCCLLRRSLSGVAIAQRLVHFSAYPQPVQQDSQLPGHRYNRPLLGVLPTTLRQR